MIKNLKKKKKAFTLVEVIIVLAIIAIIAAIAIPNLTKVRTESKRKADVQSCETIRRTILTLITEDSIKVDVNKGDDASSNPGIELLFEMTGGKVTGIDGLVENSSTTTGNLAPNVTEDYVVGYFEGIKAPQMDGAVTYRVVIDTDGEVYAASVDGDGKYIAGQTEAAVEEE